MHTYTRAQHTGILSLSLPLWTHLFLSLSLSLSLSLCVCVCVSVSLHGSVLLLYECTLTYSHTCELTLKHSITCHPFPFFVLVEYIKNCAHFSSCLSYESLSLRFLFPPFFFFGVSFSSNPSFMTDSLRLCLTCGHGVSYK